jgi:hypothetical protein
MGELWMLMSWALAGDVVPSMLFPLLLAAVLGIQDLHQVLTKSEEVGAWKAGLLLQESTPVTKTMVGE